MEKDLEKIGDSLFELGRDLIFRDGELTPYVYFQTSEKMISVPIISYNPEDVIDRYRLSLMIRETAKTLKARAVYFLSEAWFYDCQDTGITVEGMEKWWGNLSQEEKDKRKVEVVSVFMRTDKGELYVKKSRIKRLNGAVWVEPISDWDHAGSTRIQNWTE